MADESQRNRRGAKDTAAEAIKWGKRARWLLGFTGCGCFWPAAGCLALVLLTLIVIVIVCQIPLLPTALGWTDLCPP